MKHYTVLRKVYLVFSTCFLFQFNCIAQNRFINGRTVYLVDSGAFMVYTETHNSLALVGHNYVPRHKTEGYFCMKSGDTLLPLHYAYLKKTFPQQKEFLLAARKTRWSYDLWEKKKKSNTTWVNFLYSKYANK